MSYNTSALCDLLHSVWHSLDSSMLLQMALFHPLRGWVIFHHIYVSHLLHPFLYWWTFAAAAKSLQSCTILWDPIDGSPPGSPVPGILQARTLEWVAISFCNAWKWKVKVKSLSRVRPSATPWTAAHQAPPPMGFSRQEYWSGVPLPSPDRHLGGFYILATVSSATMNIGVHASFRIMFSSRYMLGSGIAVLCVHTCSVTQTLCDLMDCSLPGSFVHGMVQARILEWVANFSSRESS